MWEIYTEVDIEIFGIGIAVLPWQWFFMGLGIDVLLWQ